MIIEIDPIVAGGSGGGLATLATVFYYWLKHQKRQDSKAETVESSWKEVVNLLRDEVKQLKTEVEELRKKVMECENERLKTEIALLQFEKRYGPLKEHTDENSNTH